MACLAAACSKADAKKAGKGDAVIPVQTERVRQETLQRTIEIVGTLAAVDQVTMSAEAEGRVSRIAADLGDRVTAGQVLLELDREKPQYTSISSSAALTRALAKYGAADPEHLPPVEQTPDVQKARAELEQAQRAFERAQELSKRQLVSQQTLDDADDRAAVQAGELRLGAAERQEPPRRHRASEAAMKLADRQLRDTSIRAPFDGYIEKRLVTLGELVKAQTPVMSVVRVDPLKVIAEIPEKMAPWIKDGQPVELQVDAYPDRTFDGKVSRISPAVSTRRARFRSKRSSPTRTPC